MSERSALESAAVWHTLARTMVDGPDLSADEANYVLARVVEVLGDVLPLAAASVDGNQTAKLPAWRDAVNELSVALRDMKP
ncbi:hypothetical protein [Streptomyces sp. NPDC001698]|uniref:hypothetical protein n=1 Tax=Streptomyces sp. NPDC001698 TaxID=3364601 RepID=UPI003695A04E